MNDQLKTEVQVREIPDMTVAYVRHIGPYKGDNALFGSLIGQLMTWAGPRNLLTPDAKLLAVYHDNPEITEADKQRVSMCLTVPEKTEVGGEIGKMVIPGGPYAMARFEINADEYQQAWDTVMAGWFPESGYQPTDGLSYELYHGSPDEHPAGKHVLDICVPVEPL